MAVRRREDIGLQVGDSIVVVLELEGVDVTVGTLSRVDARFPVSGGHAMFDISGKSLVKVEWVPEDRVSITPVDADDGEEAVIGPALSALRRYMAVRSEAGEGGDIHVQLSGDPVVASHEVASHLRVSGPEVQDVLEAGTAAERLHRATMVLERETKLLEAVLGRER